MGKTGWAVVDVVARSLDAEEREVVLGDLTESGESAWQGLLDVLSLAVRRESEVWNGWRPWVAAFGVAIPCSFLLMGVSLSVCQAYLALIDPRMSSGNNLSMGWALLLLLCHVLLLVGWSWTAGFVVGSVSQATVWVSAILCCSPCLLCLTRFQIPSLSRYCLLLFLLPAVWGARWGWQTVKLKLNFAIVLAVFISLVMTFAGISGRARWWSPPPLVLNGFLIWPAWYLVFTSRRLNRQTS